MRRLSKYLVCVATSLTLLLTPVQAEEGQEELPDSEGPLWVWYPTAKCKTKPEKGSPGSSPETAITPRDFGDLKIFALLATDPDWEPEGERQFKSDCKWVRLTGFFRTYNDYDYRGRLFFDAKSSYVLQSFNYIIEDYGDPSTRAGDLQARGVTLVGRFYSLCSAAERDEKAPGETWRLMASPCDHGGDQGMMLADVMIEKVHDDKPRFLTGEQNRDVIRELVPYKGGELKILTKKIRAWAAMVQSGAEAYAEHSMSTHPLYKDQSKEHIEYSRKKMTNPDSYVSYLSQLRAFQEIDTETAPVAVFTDLSLAEGPRNDQVMGCICMKNDCTDRWPLFDDDARDYVGAAACTLLNRWLDDPGWYW